MARNHVAQADAESVASPQQIEESEQGEALMFKRVLLKTEKEKQDPEQRCLFKTVCKSGGKCCKVFVDSGSTDNLVSQEMAENLKLKRTKYPNPSWFQKGHQLLVSEQSLVSFQIGNYKDEVMCDIMPMDSWHILLGRPWQFDREAMYGGRKNTNTIFKDGNKFTLSSLTEKFEIEGSPIVCLSMEKGLLKATKEIGSNPHEVDNGKERSGIEGKNTFFKEVKECSIEGTKYDNLKSKIQKFSVVDLVFARI